MSFQTRFELIGSKLLFWKSCGRVLKTEWQEGSKPHGGQAGGGFSELKGRGGVESLRGNVNMKELGDVGRCRIVRCVKGEEQNFKGCAVYKGEPIGVAEEPVMQYYDDKKGVSVLILGGRVLNL